MAQSSCPPTCPPSRKPTRPVVRTAHSRSPNQRNTGDLHVRVPYVGKIATSLDLYESGYTPISDSVIVLDTFNRSLQPYAGPIGFRRESLRANHEWIRCVDHRETISPDTGLVVLVRPDDVFPGRVEPRPVTFDLHVHLRKGHGKP